MKMSVSELEEKCGINVKKNASNKGMHFSNRF
jgi:hypothetical protein